MVASAERTARVLATLLLLPWVISVAGFAVARASPTRPARSQTKPKHTAEHNLADDFNRNSMLLLRKYVLFGSSGFNHDAYISAPGNVWISPHSVTDVRFTT